MDYEMVLFKPADFHSYSVASVHMHAEKIKVKSSHLYLYRALYNKDCVKAALQSQIGK